MIETGVLYFPQKYALEGCRGSVSRHAARRAARRTKHHPDFRADIGLALRATGPSLTVTLSLLEVAYLHRTVIREEPSDAVGRILIANKLEFLVSRFCSLAE